MQAAAPAAPQPQQQEEARLRVGALHYVSSVLGGFPENIQHIMNTLFHDAGQRYGGDPHQQAQWIWNALGFRGSFRSLGGGTQERLARGAVVTGCQYLAAQQQQKEELNLLIGALHYVSGELGTYHPETRETMRSLFAKAQQMPDSDLGQQAQWIWDQLGFHGSFRAPDEVTRRQLVRDAVERGCQIYRKLQEEEEARLRLEALDMVYREMHTFPEDVQETMRSLIATAQKMSCGDLCQKAQWIWDALGFQGSFRAPDEETQRQIIRDAVEKGCLYRDQQEETRLMLDAFLSLWSALYTFPEEARTFLVYLFRASRERYPTQQDRQARWMWRQLYFGGSFIEVEEKQHVYDTVWQGVSHYVDMEKLLDILERMELEEQQPVATRYTFQRRGEDLQQKRTRAGAGGPTRKAPHLAPRTDAKRHQKRAREDDEEHTADAESEGPQSRSFFSTCIHAVLNYFTHPKKQTTTTKRKNKKNKKTTQIRKTKLVVYGTA
ncbi:hypothetical protein, conserved [Angomonas deanei]|uniref:Uncharacterized protein n=1 Tax=Angomonas deanei TaxID=59799 RepID=A0A7G2CLR8_9TRYP|nr:hypothetical protein, conserved [Angomonas deanei]